MAKSRKIASTKTVTTEMTTDADVVVVKKGMGWEGAVAVVTALVLIAAILCVDYDLGHKFNQGMFFKH